jgi:hypothetical protein
MDRILSLAVGIMMLSAGRSEAASWQIEMVDQAGTGKFSSLKIDKNGNAHLAYVVDDGKDSLKYAFWDRALERWFLMTVAEGASFSSLVLDSKERPHISYADSGTIRGCKLRHVYWDGAAWKNEAIPLSADTIAYYTSIVLDANDNPSISFYEYDGPRGTEFRVRMRVVTRDAGYWQVRTVDGQNQSGKFNAMDIDARGRIHLAYANVNAGTAGIRYGLWDGQEWNTEIVDGREQNNGELVGYSASIILDKEGDPHVSYTNYTTPSIKYAVRKNRSWQTEVVDALSGMGYPDRNSIALDDDDRPYVSYYDGRRGIIKVAHREGQTWAVETVDGNGAGFTSSLQIHRGMIWVSYADQANSGLKVARRTLDSRQVSRADERATATGTRDPAVRGVSK